MSDAVATKKNGISPRRILALALAAVIAGSVVAVAAAAFGNPQQSQAAPASGDRLKSRLDARLGQRAKHRLAKWQAPRVPKVHRLAPSAPAHSAAPTVVNVPAPPEPGNDNSSPGSSGGDDTNPPPPATSDGGDSTPPGSDDDHPEDGGGEGD